MVVGVVVDEAVAGDGLDGECDRGTRLSRQVAGEQCDRAVGAGDAGDDSGRARRPAPGTGDGRTGDQAVSRVVDGDDCL